MKVWHCGNFIDVTIGQRFLVARCGSGHTYFGEYATLKVEMRIQTSLSQT